MQDHRQQRPAHYHHASSPFCPHYYDAPCFCLAANWKGPCRPAVGARWDRTTDPNIRLSFEPSENDEEQEGEGEGEGDEQENEREGKGASKEKRGPEHSNRCFESDEE